MVHFALVVGDVRDEDVVAVVGRLDDLGVVLGDRAVAGGIGGELRVRGRAVAGPLGADDVGGRVASHRQAGVVEQRIGHCGGVFTLQLQLLFVDDLCTSK